MTACTKKSTAITPYPSASSSAADNVQNYAPYQQGTQANPDYYGNGATLTNDNGEFNNPTPQATAGTNSTGTGTLGRVCIYIHEENIYKKVVADSHVTVIRPILIESKFIYFWIASDFVQSEI